MSTCSSRGFGLLCHLEKKDLFHRDLRVNELDVERRRGVGILFTVSNDGDRVKIKGRTSKFDLFTRLELQRAKDGRPFRTDVLCDGRLFPDRPLPFSYWRDRDLEGQPVSRNSALF